MSNLNKEINETMLKFKKEAFRQVPLFIKVRNILISIDNLESEDKVDWKKVNQLLRDTTIEYDYNIFDDVNSVDDLMRLDFDINTADILNNPWYKQKCKDCKNEFTLTKGEISYFERNNLNIPKRCKSCRDKRRKNDSKN